MTSAGTMQAAILDAPGAAFRMAAVPRPAPQPGQVLVRIAASAVNPLDLKIRAGQAAHARQPLPAILGIDLAGTVEAAGDGVTEFRPGDEVYGMTGGVGGLQGSLAQYAAVDADLLAPKPANPTMREATRLVEAGKLVPRVDPRNFTLSSVGDAHRAIEANDAAGKIVVNIND